MGNRYAAWNKFRNLEQIPAGIRYRWMLDNTRLLVDHPWIPTKVGTHSPPRMEVPRTSARFWTMAEWLNAWQERHAPVDAGILDISAYDRRTQ